MMLKVSAKFDPASIVKFAFITSSATKYMFCFLGEWLNVFGEQIFVEKHVYSPGKKRPWRVGFF